MLSKSLIALVLLAWTSSTNAHMVIAPPLGVGRTPTVDDVQKPSSSSPCGNIDIAKNLENSTAANISVQGEFAVDITIFDGGSRDIKAFQVDKTGKGDKFDTIGTIDAISDTDNATQRILAKLAAGTICSGGKNQNLCLLSFNATDGFGNCVVVSQPPVTIVGTSVSNSVTDFATATDSTTDTGSASATDTSSASATDTATASATDTATFSATDTATASATDSATASATDTVTASVTDTATASATDSASDSATSQATDTLTVNEKRFLKSRKRTSTRKPASTSTPASTSASAPASSSASVPASSVPASSSTSSSVSASVCAPSLASASASAPASESASVSIPLSASASGCASLSVSQSASASAPATSQATEVALQKKRFRFSRT